jgi:probable aminopeptidase NPEPL1
MKMDMAGAAAVLAGFEAAVELQVSKRLTAILCIAENAVGPNAVRPDDLVQMFSGKTVEINNTDAEGRLVLADGVAWAAKHRSPDVIIDIATLTGAQAVATGKHHAAIYCNHEDWEVKAVVAGKLSGDLTHPLPYCPEFFRKEFRSQVADMKNSVKDRANGQAACAGQFIGNHLDKYKGIWLHVDMAGPSKEGGRATGYGVGLFLALADLL